MFKMLHNIFSPVLSDEQIMRHILKNKLIEGGITDHQLQPNSVDLTLADSWKKLISNSDSFAVMVDPRNPMNYLEGTFKDTYIMKQPDEMCYILKPKEFVLMATNEILNIPNGLVALVQGRSSIARMAVQTEQAGFIDAGFRGTITLEVFNQSDNYIKLYPGMRIAQVYFLKAQYANNLYSKSIGSKYNDQILATGSKIHLDSEFKNEGE